MKVSQFDPSWETNIYSRHTQINRYPYGELISVFFQNLRLLNTGVTERSKTRLLEIGSGAGNNLWFFCQEGFDVYGIDGSATACRIAREQLEERDCRATVRVAEFDDMPMENESVDIVIDREATYCGMFEDIKNTWSEVDRILKPGGLVISFFFADDHPDCIQAKSDPQFANRLEDNTYTDFKAGTFEGTGVTHFATRTELDDIFSFLSIRVINKHSSQPVFSSGRAGARYSEWIVAGVKQ